MCCSIHDIYEDPEIRGWRKQFEALQLKRSEVEKLYRIFRKVDADGSGTIELIELLVHIDLERTKFTERIFSIFDEDGSGQIDFREFVVALWNYWYVLVYTGIYAVWWTFQNILRHRTEIQQS